jgi:hypothetical protein
MRPGTYEIKIRYKAPSGYENRWGGVLEFREDSGLADSAPLKLRIAPAQEYSEVVTPTQSIVMGTMTLGGARAALVLRATHLDANSVGVAKVLGIDLTPVSTTPTSAAAPEPAELLDLRQKHLKIQREKLQPTHQAWLNLLKEMSAAAEANPDQEILAEKNRVSKLVGSAADPASPSILTTSGKGRTIKLNPLDGLSVTSAGSLRTANTGTHLESITTGSRISFRITPEKVPAGSYRVAISTKLGPGMGGAYHLKVNEKTVSGEMNHNQYDARAHRWEPSGVLKFPAAPCYLEFHVDSTVKEKGSLCDLYGVELIPVDAP